MAGLADIAVIGGSGFYEFLENAEEVKTETPFGPPSDPIAVGEVAGKRVAFLPRHGRDHRFPPHKIPYRANLWALRALGVRRIVAPSAVGSLTASYGPGTLVIPDQLVDRTSGRAQTYYDSCAVADRMDNPLSMPWEKKLSRAWKTGLGVVAYHAACHLRAQKIGFPGMRVLSVIPDTEVRMVEECSAVDGTWGMKAAHYETGRKYAGKMVRGIAAAEADLVVTDCSLSALRIGKENAVRPIHPIQAVARAYGLVD